MTIEKAPLTSGVRYAPSPTGRLHLGNLRTAWVSERWARSLSIPWVVRFEDIDRPRVISGAREQQTRDMRALGLEPDVVLVQSRFNERHLSVFENAVRSEQVYPCDCSRREVQAAVSAMASAPHGPGHIYSGRCRTLDPRRTFNAVDSIAWRFKMPAESGHDDFIVSRSALELDGSGLPEPTTFTPAYHWACAIDDFDGGYALLVRSVDLSSAAALQRGIQTWLASYEGAEPRLPKVFHTTLIVQDDGQRLEKRTLGVTLDELFEKGATPASIVMNFEKSFDRRWLAKGLTFDTAGETNEKLTLSELELLGTSC
ncbi:MAG: glutamate--tRNA ligase family protein [Bdellovibrionota bacterium]